MNFDTNEMMMDLFRSEVESHSESLASGLLQLEREPTDTSVYDGMMRSAHSIKGAARIVRVESAVNLAHIMEDCFVAAQREELRIQPSDFDLLLRSVDLLVRISEGTKHSATLWDELDGEVRECVEQLKSLRQGTAVETIRVNPAPKPIAIAPTPAPSTPAPAPIAPPAKPIATELALTVAETLDQSDAERLRLMILTGIDAPLTSVLFDLSATREIDPIGLAFLELAKRWLQSRSIGVQYQSASDAIASVLRVTGITPP